MFNKLTPVPNRVILQKSAFDTIVLEVGKGGMMLETGGILLGRIEFDSYLVTVAGDPGPNAVHKRDYFMRDLTYAQSLAADAWDADCSQWIGDWHTHPHGSLMPSVADLRSYRQHLEDPELAFTSFLSVVARSTNRGVVLAAWAVTAFRLERIKVVANFDHK